MSDKEPTDPTLHHYFLRCPRVPYRCFVVPWDEVRREKIEADAEKERKLEEKNWAWRKQYASFQKKLKADEDARPKPPPAVYKGAERLPGSTVHRQLHPWELTMGDWLAVDEQWD